MADKLAIHGQEFGKAFSAPTLTLQIATNRLFKHFLNSARALPTLRWVFCLPSIKD